MCSSFTNAHLQKVTWALNIVGELLCEFSSPRRRICCMCVYGAQLGGIRGGNIVGGKREGKSAQEGSGPLTVYIPPSAVLIFPFSLLKSLQLTHFRERVGFAVILALGITTLVVSTVRFLYMIFLINDISLGKFLFLLFSPSNAGPS